MMGEEGFFQVKVARRGWFFKLWLFVVLGISSGCGYRLLGEQEISKQRLFIPILQNSTTRPGLEEEITKALRQEVLASGRIKLASEENADLRLDGKITSYELTPISFDARDLTAEYRFKINTIFRLENLRENKLLWEQEYSSKFEYRVTSSIVETEKTRILALQKASRELSQELIPIIMEKLR